MRLLDVITSPWLILPEKHQEIIEIYCRHLRGEKIDMREIRSLIGGPAKDGPESYEVLNGTAIIPVEGVIAKKMNMLTEISDGTSTELVARDLKEAAKRKDIKSIVLRVDSPGGTVDGTQELAKLVFSLRAVKPIIAYADGTCCSAAYWIAAAADKVFISSNTTMVGSIGVVATHLDVSKAQEMRGLKTTEIAEGKYKGAASSYRPLSEEGEAAIRQVTRPTYLAFVEDIAKLRDRPLVHVMENMAEGKIFVGRDAIEVGLADGIIGFDDLLRALSGNGELSGNHIGGTSREREGENLSQARWITQGEALMPYADEHSCRLHDPDEYQDGKEKWTRVPRKSASVGKIYDVIRGTRKDTGKMEDQAFRYKEDTWSEAEARGHCGRHNGQFEAAKKDESRAEGETMTKEELKEQFPDVFAAIDSEAELRGLNVGTEVGRKEGRELGAREERERIKGVSEKVMPGHEELIKTLIYDGKTTPAEAAEKVLAAEQVVIGKRLQDFREDGPSVTHADAPEETGKPAADASASVEDKAKAAWDKDENLRAEFGGDFGAYKAFRKHEEAGDVKIHHGGQIPKS
ncbi:MAG: S49 family peptidase [Candidatus Eisenbacteria bacterium]|nr:S49 family peptidase [Candidatus Eisenbacteria bacterium]